MGGFRGIFPREISDDFRCCHVDGRETNGALVRDGGGSLTWEVAGEGREMVILHMNSGGLEENILIDTVWVGGCCEESYV